MTAPRPAFHIQPQPDGTTCGPTCLHALYRHYGVDLDIEQLVREVPKLDDGGTMAVHLALHALRRGWSARIHTYNVNLFDPTWFREPRPDLAHKLAAQARVKSQTKKKLAFASKAYIEYIERGGAVEMEDLTDELVADLLEREGPILCGLSSTWLYRGPRERGNEPVDDDVAGVPQGHFVVLVGWDGERREVRVADPLRPNPLSPEPIYSIGVDRLVASILLGIVTYDAVLLMMRPPGG